MNNYETDQRKKLLSFFKNNAHEIFSAKRISEIMIDQGISTSAIYRNISFMEKEGLLCRVANTNNRETLYQYIDPEECTGMIHMICDKCNETHHLNKHVSELVENMALDGLGFWVNTKKTVIYGLCDTCSKDETKRI